jgi:ParB family transcriptional regulator, chromosome partitioning protein
MAQSKGLVRPENTRDIPISLITPSLTNKHTGERFKRAKMAELAASIKANGIIQPLLVRPINDENRPGKKFEIVAGERRYRGAELAELRRVPCVVTELCDAAALELQLTENLQRENLHPLDEARAFLRLQKESELDIFEIAARVGKDVREVARTLSLNNLIKQAREDYRAGFITLGHALEICRLPREVQHAALAACYWTRHVWDEEAQEYKPAPDKAKARGVKELTDWIRANVHLNLRSAPFKTTDARLREDGLTCADCKDRTGYNTTLFADVKGADTCLVPACFHGKVKALIQIKTSELDAKRETPATVVTPNYSTSATADDGREVLTRSRYEIIEDGQERCEYAEQSVYVEGASTGKTVLICREATCKDHLGRVRGHANVAVSRSAGGETESQDAAAKRHARKQELFDIKVDEEVRKRVMREALTTYTHPLDRETLNAVALAHFRRIPASDQRTIIEVFGCTDEESSALRTRGDEGLKVLAKLTDDRLAQFMVLCSVAHFGANQYGNRQVSQEDVERLSKARGVNHRLIDAEVRHGLAPKKYKERHEKYLAAVREGKRTKKPTVFAPQPQAASAGTKAKKAA